MHSSCKTGYCKFVFVESENEIVCLQNILANMYFIGLFILPQSGHLSPWLFVPAILGKATQELGNKANSNHTIGA